MTESRVNLRPISDHALIGDMRGCALVARDGAIEWACLERFDAAPTFAAMLDAGRGGACTVRLRDGVHRSSRRYVDDSNVLETTLEGAHARLRITDFMPVRDVATRRTTGADSEAPGWLVRRIVAQSGCAEVTLRIDPVFDWGRRPALATSTGTSAHFGAERLHIASSHRLVACGAGLTIATTLDPGEVLTLVMSPHPIDADAVATTPGWLAASLAYWTTWSARCSYVGPDDAAVRRSLLCLKALTYAPSGGIVAAATAGLPEVRGGVRNWDYRFVWTRDASFCVSAFIRTGHQREAAEFLRFLHGACHGGEAVRVMYAVEGELPEVDKLYHLAGCHGAVPIIVGNEAADQRQHEIHGELLASINLYVTRYGFDGLCPDLQRDLGPFVERLARATIARWRDPDQGIWELKGPPRQLLHSKVMCWVALDRALLLAPQLGLTAPAAWARERDRIREECLTRGWNADLGAFTMEFGGTALDMSMLRIALMNFLPADDPRMKSTLDALQKQLSRRGLHRRYDFDDGLPGVEGVFLACSFWVVGLLSRRGDAPEARTLMDRLLHCANDVGLLAEQLDPVSRDQLGNFPQAFTHMALIHEAVQLAEDAGASASQPADPALLQDPR